MSAMNDCMISIITARARQYPTELLAESNDSRRNGNVLILYNLSVSLFIFFFSNTIQLSSWEDTMHAWKKLLALVRGARIERPGRPWQIQQSRRRMIRGWKNVPRAATINIADVSPW